MHDAIIDKRLLYLGSTLIVIVLYCVISCQTDKVSLSPKVLESEKLTAISESPSSISKSGQIEQPKTPDILYEEQRINSMSNSMDNSTYIFTGDEVVSPELLMLEETAKKENMSSFVGDEVVTPELLRLESESSSVQSKTTTRNDAIVPKALQTLEEKSPTKQSASITQDSDVVPLELQKIE